MAMRASPCFAAASAAFVRPISRLSSILSLMSPTAPSRGPSSFSASSSQRHWERITSPCHKRTFRQTPFRTHAMMSCFQSDDIMTRQSWPQRRHGSTSCTSQPTPLAYTSSTFGRQRQRQFNSPKGRSHTKTITRLFGSNPNSPYATPGHVLLSDDRDDTASIPINLSALQRTIETTREIIGYPTYDVTLSLVDEDYMQEINLAARGMDSTTDVLSFCFQENFVEPGVLGKVQFDIGDYYNLGDMLIDVDYVKRKCEEDEKLHREEKRGPIYGDDSNDGMVEGEVISEHDAETTSQTEEEDEDGEHEYEYIEVEVDEWDDRGVAPAMQYVYNPEIRIHMLIVHGMLHLVGYDHIEDDDYELMVVREDEVLAELRKRLGHDFGVGDAPPQGDAK